MIRFEDKKNADESRKRRAEIASKYDFLKVTKKTIRPNTIDERLSFEVEDGWLPLLEDLFEKMATVVKRDNLAEFQIVQVKEKFGGLRVYIHNGNKDINDLISAAEAKAWVTCEYCGEPGECHSFGGWYITECDVCLMIRKLDDNARVWGDLDDV
jgi:hypothetical protein